MREIVSATEEYTDKVSVREEQAGDIPFYRLPAAEVAARLESDPKQGLASAEAAARLERYGPNELQAKVPTPKWRRFLEQFNNPLVILLLVATVISLVAWVLEGAHGAPFEAIAIILIVLLNSVIGYFQEERAEEAVAALQKMAVASAIVIREGRQQTVASRELVPGDVLVIEEGTAIAADGRLLDVTSLQVAEAALTGESQPTNKKVGPIDHEVGLGDRDNMVYSGTIVTFGRGRAVVTATGMQTQMGKIAGMIQAAPEEPTPLQIEIESVGRLLGISVIVIAIVIIATVLLVDNVRSLPGLVDALILGVSLAVAAVPEGLPTILTVVLALGVQRMVARNAIVKKLLAVETLGSASVICTDKTGTLTKNEMTVRTVVTPSGRVDLAGTGYEPFGELSMHETAAPVSDEELNEELRLVLGAGALANNAVVEERDGIYTIQGDPTEAALLVAARKLGITDEELKQRFSRIGEVPFSSERKMMSTVQRVNGDAELAVITKGAPDVLLARCDRERVGDTVQSLTEERRAEIRAMVETLAAEALRTLGLAYRRLAHESYDEAGEHLEADLVFLGIVGIIDPPRPEAAAAVKV
ncbi:MAG: HAD-IC family P-type ATPase, partial [Caldilineaceae bacterium]|nr:HAD-IC family P-type ATPase [Caldilineaceae bacterium]